MPIIVIVEWVLLLRANIKHPFLLSLYANLVSGLIGIIPAVLSTPLMLGPVLPGELKSIMKNGSSGIVATTIVISIAATIGAIIFFWWLSSHIEYRFSQKTNRWCDQDLSLSLFYRVNAVTYGLIFLFFGYLVTSSILEVLTNR